MKLTIKILIIVILVSVFGMPAKPSRAGLLSRPVTNLGLVGYWPLDEGYGSKAEDVSGSGNIGSVSGASWTDGKRGRALNFGSDNFVDAGSNSSLDFGTGSFSISVWTKVLSNDNNWHNLISKKTSFNGTNIGWMAWLDFRANGVMEFRVNDGSAINDQTPTNSTDIKSSVQNGNWHHFVWVVNSDDTVTFYFDGNYQSNQSFSPMTSTLSNNVNFRIGKSQSDASISSKIDDVRIYNRALSTAEISKLYSSGQITSKKVSEQGLVGYWPMNEAQGNKVGDSSGKGNTGTVSGANWTSGKKGGALNFNGTDGFVNLTSSGLNNPSLYGGVNGKLTFSAWIKPTRSTGINFDTIARRIGGFHYLAINNSTDRKLILMVADVVNAINFWPTSTASIDIDKWSHIVFQLEGGVGAKIYINGVLDTNFSNTNLGITDYGANTAFAATLNDASQNNFKGLMDEVRIYNRILSSAEIFSLYKQNETLINAPQNDKLTNGLVGLWPFNGKDISTTIAYDRSGNGNNATMSGAKLDAGKVGQGLNFNSGSIYATSSPSLNITNSISISAWFYPKSEFAGYAYHPIHKWGSTNDANYVWYYFGAVSGMNRSIGLLANAGGIWQGITPYYVIPTLNTWYHVVFTYDAVSGGRTYINGVMKGNPTGGAGVLANNTSNLVIGETADYIMDEVRIYNRVINISEIKQLYNLGK